MKRIITALSAVVALSLPSLVLAAVWTIDPEHSHGGFKVRHLMVSNVKGHFEKFSGTVGGAKVSFAPSVLNLVW
uniref:Lipid/polyisoprenoid-binding YceI-like domain-containing protein n=1 Tax=Geobacter metallireducens TaxID=28232 RepID=A0A831TYG3_GEOME